MSHLSDLARLTDRILADSLHDRTKRAIVALLKAGHTRRNIAKRFRRRLGPLSLVYLATCAFLDQLAREAN